MIAWFARNGVAANLLLIAIVVAGALSLSQWLVLEVFPEFESDIVEVQVVYRGATPAEIEEALVVRIEEAIADLVGIEEIRSTASEDRGTIQVEIASGYRPRELLDDIKNRVDAIGTFPTDAERPTYRIAKRRREVIGVVISGQLPEAELRQLGERARRELTALPGVTQVDLDAVRAYELAIELSELTLQEQGLTFNEVVAAIRNSSLDVPAGSLKTAGGEIRLRTLGQSYVGNDFKQIVIRQRTDGTQLTVGDIATVLDGFEETPVEARFNDEPCVLLEVYRVGDQNAIELAAAVRTYVEQAAAALPPGVKIEHWRDRSKIIKKRLNTLLWNAAQGGALVLLLLGLFLRWDVALWVCIGIPVSFMGALAVMPWLGVTINIISVFAFILVLGIVVDDAIVTGENIYSHLRRGGDAETAVIQGTREIALPVIFGVLTTVATFLPVLAMGGRRGPIFAQIPLIVIPVLLVSLLESKLILPSHLKHIRMDRDRAAGGWTRLQERISNGLDRTFRRFYQPVLEFALLQRYLTLSVFLAALLIIGSAVYAGHLRYIFFPRVQSEVARATLVMPIGTPFDATRQHVMRMSEAAEQLRAQSVDAATDQSVIKDILATYGSTGGGSPQSHLGRVMFEIVPPEDRKSQVTSSQLVQKWRKLIGPIPGAKELTFRAEIGRSSDPIDIQLAGDDLGTLQELSDQVKQRLARYPGVFDISDSFDEGKQEVQLRLKPGAEFLGIHVADLAQQVRQGFFGAEVQRIQRGREDIRVMVRYPQAERSSFGYLDSMLVRTASGQELPFSEVADVTMILGLSDIRRVNRQRTVSVIADVNKDEADATAINADLATYVAGLVAQRPGVHFAMAGEAQEQADSSSSLTIGLVLVLFIIYALLAIPFKSYLQPLVVMSVIPFGWAGAALGHVMMGMNLSIFSVLGMLALTGVVVNDSLVMIDFVNRYRRRGHDVYDAVRQAGVDRLRAILLTSLTTFAGLTPLILEKSTQAQFLIPMAVSLGFGVLFATFVTLLLIPVAVLILEDGIRMAKTLRLVPAESERELTTRLH